MQRFMTLSQSKVKLSCLNQPAQPSFRMFGIRHFMLQCISVHLRPFAFGCKSGLAKSELPTRSVSQGNGLGGLMWITRVDDPDYLAWMIPDYVGALLIS